MININHNYRNILEKYNNYVTIEATQIPNKYKDINYKYKHSVRIIKFKSAHLENKYNRQYHRIQTQIHNNCHINFNNNYLQ